MVLRKPYAFFIRFFKVFHIILAALIIYSITRMVGVITFINSYLDANLTIISKNDFYSIFGFQDFLVPFLMLGLNVLLLTVMTIKKKPNKFYTFATLGTIFIIILNWYGYSTMKELTKVWLDAGGIGILADVYIFALMINVVMCAITISRAIGFNIGRFDFNSDILEFDLSEEDNAEFEFVLDFDINDVKRNTQKKVRYFKYFVKENKGALITVGVTILGGVLLYGLYYNLKYGKDIIKGDSLTDNGFTIKVNNAYMVNSSLDGEKLPNDTHLVVIDADITNNTFKDATIFKAGALNLSIGDNNYYITKNYDDEIMDLGELYINEKVKLGETINKLIVFEVPKSNLSGKIYLGLNNLENDSEKYIKLNTMDLTNLKEIDKEYKLGDNVNLDESMLTGVEIKINNYEIKDKFAINYKYKIGNSSINSYEYLLPDYYNTNYDKLILKLEGNFNFDDDSRIKNFYTLFEKFGYLEYKINGKVYTQDKLFKQVKSKKVRLNNTYYIEILDYIKDAKDIYLGLKIRNIDYRFKLEKGQG